METFTTPVTLHVFGDYCYNCGTKYDGTNAREVCPAAAKTETRGEHKAAFNAAVDEVLGQALTISNQRGGEYADSWALENQQTRFLDVVILELKEREDFTRLTPEEKRLLLIAGMCDVKMSRMIGGFKGDTLDDLINYVAALRKWLGDYVMRNDNSGGEQAA